ncbi:MAG: hypothetical protein R3C11_06010 [Planctomycetaceae bacterium]
MKIVRQLCFMLSRFFLSAWVGAAAIFVVTSIVEQTSEEFDSLVRDQLALMRFPYYYLFGFILLGGSLGTLLLTDRSKFWIRWWISVGLLVVTLVIVLIDYFAIYMPLQNMISPPGTARTPEFESYHNYSKYINELHVTLALITALILCSVGMGQGKASKK